MPTNGVQTAFKLVPSKHGLFSVCPPATSGSGDVQERWVRGFAQELESRPNLIINWFPTSNVNSEVFTSTLAASAIRYIQNISPFFVEVEDNASTLGILGEDRFARVLRQLEAASEKAVEFELWHGNIVTAEGLETPHLVGPTSTVLNSGTALSPARGLALLEHTIGFGSAIGAQGVIHMTRDAFSLLAVGSQVQIVDDQAQTRGGTPIVIGSGYSGSGPDSLGVDALPTNNTKWMYATGSLGVFLGESEVVNDTLGQGYDVSGNKNDMKIKASRPAVAYFDPAIHLAVKLDLTAV